MPFRLSTTVLLMVLIVSSGCRGAAVPEAGLLEGVLLERPVSKPAFTLTDTNGARYDFAAETDGRLTLLYFGYTNCPDVCPVHLAQLAEVFDRLPEVRRNAAVVFVTVDPDRDTPEALDSFVGSFNDEFVALTGTQNELEQAQLAAGVPIAVREGEGESYTMGHAGQVLVYSPNGKGYSVYPFGTRQSTWMHDLPILLDRVEA
ncbi:MAG: SCO family protein [Acidimicrobiia bacterium]